MSINPFYITDLTSYPVQSTDQLSTNSDHTYESQSRRHVPRPDRDPSVHDQLLRAALADQQSHPQFDAAQVNAPHPQSEAQTQRPAPPHGQGQHTHQNATVAAQMASAVADELPQPSADGQEPQLPPDDTPPNLHREILVAQDFLSEDICDEYIEYIRQQQEIELSVFDADETNRTGHISWEVDKKTRDTNTVDIEPVKEVVFELMHYAVRDFLNPFFNVAIKDSEMPQILIYHPGGHYKPHIDGEALFNDGTGVLKWKRNVERDISMVLYLNDDYEGGEIVFPKQAISIKPRKGMLVAFPSNHHFLHGVNPVTSGDRYAIVNWFSLGQPASL